MSNPIDQLISHLSDRMRLRIAVAWFLRLKAKLLGWSRHRKQLVSVEEQHVILAPRSGTLMLDEVSGAEDAIIRYRLQQRFSEDISAPSSKKATVSRCRAIYKLDPFLEDGLLRVGGRLNKVSMPEESNHRPILSKEQHVSVLILNHVHQNVGHGRRSHTLSNLRKKFWITNTNSAVRNFMRHKNGRAVEQKMAYLPEEKILPDLPPFTNTGITLEQLK